MKIKNNIHYLKKLLMHFFFIGQAIPLFAQSNLAQTSIQFTEHADENPTEKTYLHLNKPWYNRADTIWFKAYTVIGDRHRLSALSGVAYVELISPQDSIVQRLNLQLRSGTASGDFALPITLAPGTYRIRSYTNWMKNKGEDSFYDRQVVIGHPLGVINLLKKDKKRDKSIVKIPSIQFFPEGGDLVAGLRNVVAFKSLNPDGSPASIKGSIVDADSGIIAEIESTHAGMGSFAINPKAGQMYTAKVQFGNGNIQTVALPIAVSSGYVLTVNNQDPDSLLVKIAANPALFKTDKGKGFYLIANAGDSVCYTTQGKLIEAAYNVRIVKNHFPAGVIRLTLFAASGEPLNERVVFIKRPDNLDLNMGANKTTYASADNVTLDISAAFKANPVAGSFSAAVINEDKTPADENTEPTIFSGLLLSPELHGNISNPGYYLKDQSEKTTADLDLLMLTQGYRKLKWKNLLDTTRMQPQYLPEDGLSITGKVTTLSGKPVANGKVSLFSAQRLLKLDTVTDVDGRFIFTGIDITDKASFIIKAYNGKSQDVHINITKPIIGAGQYPAVPVIDTASSQELQKSYKNEELFYQKLKGHQLKEVTIKGRYDPNKGKPDLSTSANIHGGGNADEVVMNTQLAQMGCPTLRECLAVISMGARAKAIVTGSHAITYIDGTIGNMNDISVQDIYSVEILSSVKYTSVYGVRGLILITTKKGIPANELVTVEKAPGLISYKFSGYYKARTFYNPKYDVETLIDQPSAIYWQPDIITDKDGKATLQYNNAGKGNYRVVVEGIDSEGRLGRLVYRYKVE